jgi:hypothetical protein
MRTYLIETNVGTYGLSMLSVWDYVTDRASDSMTHGELPADFGTARKFVGRIERPAQYPLWVAMSAPGSDACGMGRHRWHMLKLLGYWKAAGAAVTWPKSLPASQRKYWSMVGERCYQNANLRQWKRSDERCPVRNDSL